MSKKDFGVTRMKVHVHPDRDPQVMHFRCAGCHRMVCGWCQGAADDYPRLCDPCWAKVVDARRAAEARGAP